MSESVVIRGTVYAGDNSEMQTAVRNVASKFFATDCVSWVLFEIHIMSEPGAERMIFEAEFSAVECHKVMQSLGYGPNKCSKCDRESWSDNPLPTASAKVSA